jgi:NADPH-dependent curcumin reductase CurA
MNTPANRQWKLIARPVGLPKRSDFSYETNAVPEPADGEILVRNHFISLDPAMRGWMNDARSYVAPIKLGDVMRAGAVGEVVASRNAAWHEGDYAVGVFGMQDYAASDTAGVQRVDPSLAPLPLFISALGMPGMTAYFGLLDIGNPQPGQTVVVSAASGAVGALVGQIARIKGARAVGLAGGPEKCRYVTEELGFDACIDYKHDDIGRGLTQNCPNGIDVYFDNVGGEILDLCLAGPELSSAAPFPNTTTPAPSPGRKTTSRCWSTTPAWKASSSSTTPPVTPKVRRTWQPGCIRAN